MKPWIESQTTRFRWREFASTDERRVYYLWRSGEISIQPLGVHVPGLFARVARVGFVDLLPKAFPPRDLHATTADGISVTVRVEMALQVIDEPHLLRRFIADPEGQERLAHQVAQVAIQRTVATASYDDALTQLFALAETSQHAIDKKIAQDGLPLSVRNLAISYVTADDKELADAAIRRAKERVRRSEEHARLETQQIVGRLRSQVALDQHKSDAELEIIRSETERRRQEIELEVKTIMAGLSKTPEGQAVLFPDQHFKLETERVRVAGRQDEQLLRWAIQGAVSQGQAELLRTVLQKQYGFTWSSPLDAFPPIERVGTLEAHEQQMRSDTNGSDGIPTEPPPDNQ